MAVLVTTFKIGPSAFNKFDMIWFKFMDARRTKSGSWLDWSMQAY